MLDVICWKWKPGFKAYRSKFSAEHVNTLRAMVARHYQKPHRFSCITDDPAGIDPRVRVIPLWPDHGQLVSPHGFSNPSCYRRLRVFARDAGELIGPRFVSMDLDCVVVGDLAPVFDRPEHFVMWEGTAGRNFYNGSMFMLTAGMRPQVWELFDRHKSPADATAQGFVGSDQAHICNVLGPAEATWTRADGVYSWRNHLRRRNGKLPADPGAPPPRLVYFHGISGDPWSDVCRRQAPWIADHYHAR